MSISDVATPTTHPFVRDLTTQDLASRIGWERCPANPPPRRDLETSQALRGMRAQPRYVGVRAWTKKHCGTNLLSQVRMWKGHHRGLDDVRVGQKGLLDMDTRDILSTANDDLPRSPRLMAALGA